MITINLGKAKTIAHEVRRRARDEEFKPLDVKVTIPSEATQAEDQRQVVRNNDDALQVRIEDSSTPEELAVIIAPSLSMLEAN